MNRLYIKTIFINVWERLRWLMYDRGIAVLWWVVKSAEDAVTVVFRLNPSEKIQMEKYIGIF